MPSRYALASFLACREAKSGPEQRDGGRGAAVALRERRSLGTWGPRFAFLSTRLFTDLR
jgi:hypothetical protein